MRTVFAVVITTIALMISYSGAQATDYEASQWIRSLSKNQLDNLVGELTSLLSESNANISDIQRVRGLWDLYLNDGNIDHVVEMLAISRGYISSMSKMVLELKGRSNACGGGEHLAIASSITLYPFREPHGVGFVVKTIESPVIQKYDGEINASYGDKLWGAWKMRAWAIWSVSSIPDGACITSIQVRNYIWPSGDQDHVTQYRKLTADPRFNSGGNLWPLLQGNIYEQFNTGSWEGYRTHPLGGSAVGDLEAALTSTDWFAIAITENGDSDGEALIAGWGRWMPELIVEYKTRPSIPPGLPNISPNPACQGSSVTVSWSAVQGATSYRLYLDGVLIYWGSVISASEPARAGSYTVAAGNDCGWSGQSRGRTLSVVSIPSSPNRPIISPDPACQGSSVTVSWSAVQGATSYRLYRDGVQIWSGSSTSTSQPAQAGSYTVAAGNGCGWSGQSPGRTLSIISVPEVPVALVISPSPPVCEGTIITLSWSSVAGATSYCLYRDGVQVWCGSGTSTTISAQPAAEGYYTVRACNDCGCSGDSPSVQLIVTPIPPAPAPPVLTPNPACDGSTVTVSWTSVSGATSYCLYRDGVEVWCGSGTSTTVTAQAGSYTVSAGNDCGWSNQGAGRTLMIAPVPSPPNVPLVIPNPYPCSASELTVSWDPVPGATRYQVF